MSIVKIQFNKPTERELQAMHRQIAAMHDMEIVFRPDDCEHTASREWLYCQDEYLFDCAACHT